MSINLHKFVMRTLEQMYDSGESEYKVRQYALKWYTKDVLHDEDLVTVDGWYSVDEDEEETEEAEEEESKEEK
jgi:hypothetical protein|nr:MAG TPA: hypothetical protein [Caudoviricetes sp.]